jgi:hypothetical protein
MYTIKLELQVVLEVSKPEYSLTHRFCDLIALIKGKQLHSLGNLSIFATSLTWPNFVYFFVKMNLSVGDPGIELSEAEIKGLKFLNNEISEEITKKLIVNAVKQLLVKGPGKF